MASKLYYIIWQVPMQYKQVFEAENDEEAREILQEFKDKNKIRNKVTHKENYIEAQNDLLFTELARGTIYKDESNVLESKKYDY